MIQVERSVDDQKRRRRCRTVKRECGSSDWKLESVRRRVGINGVEGKGSIVSLGLDISVLTPRHVSEPVCCAKSEVRSPFRIRRLCNHAFILLTRPHRQLYCLPRSNGNRKKSNNQDTKTR